MVVTAHGRRVCTARPVTATRSRSLERRSGVPSDYLEQGLLFGHGIEARPCMPEGGDERSLQVAWVQHVVCCALRSRQGRGAGARLGRRFRFSKQQWHLCMSGQAWMGATVLAAAVAELLGIRPPGVGVADGPQDQD